MGTRTIADIAPTSATIALNAYIFGYGGHSLVTPHHAIKQLWWTEDRIRAKVTPEFVHAKLRVEERAFLHKPVAFGEGLTDDTYLEWILNRARRLFLILTDIGVPDQIFGCIDDSWDDEDLPVTLDTVRGLSLTYNNDDSVNKKFYETQFVYLLRELEQGLHIDYDINEHIPMEYANTVPPAVTLQTWDRVHFPGRPDDVYMRRKINFVDKDTVRSLRQDFLTDVKKAQRLPHEHIAQTWASYTSKDAGFILSDFVGEHSLATFMSHRMPPQYAKVSANERPIMLCEWMHCLADAIAYLHEQGIAHTAIRPSNIIINETNKISFSDVGSIKILQRGKKLQNAVEAYDYAAPELIVSKTQFHTIARDVADRYDNFTPSISGSSSTSGSSVDHGTVLRSPRLPYTASRPSTRANSIVTITGTTESEMTPVEDGPRNFSRRILRQANAEPRSSEDTLLTNPSETLPLQLPSRPTAPLTKLPRATPQQSDVFSLACIFLDIVTFLIKGRLGDFVKFRTVKIKPLRYPGAKKVGSSRLDSSFHYDPDKIHSWMALLETEAAQRVAIHPVFCGVPSLLSLIRNMMTQNPSLRPSAIRVRDSLQQTLTNECSIFRPLCCVGRQWVYADVEEDETETDLALTTTESIHDARRQDSIQEDDPDAIEEASTQNEPLFSMNASAPLDLTLETSSMTALPIRPVTASPATQRPSSRWRPFANAPRGPSKTTSHLGDNLIQHVSRVDSVSSGVERERRNSLTSIVTTDTTKMPKRNKWRLKFGR